MRPGDTEGELVRQHFSATMWSRMLAGGGPVSPETLERFLSGYWRPVYLYIRRDRAKSNEDAKDLTQAFLAHLVEHRTLERFRPEHGRLRTLLKVALKNFLTDQHRRGEAERRGGGRTALSFDAGDVERLEAECAGPESADALFDREWAYGLLVGAMDAARNRLEKAGRAAYWTVYERYDVNPPPEGASTYREVGASLGVTEEQVTKMLSYARNAVRQELMARVSEGVANEEELFSELSELLGS